LSLRSRLEALLARLPGRISRYGHDVLRTSDIRRFWAGVGASDVPLALLASHDLSLSGAPRIVLEMAQALHERGTALIVVAMADGPMRAEFEALGATILIDPRPRPGAAYLRRLAERAEIAIGNSVASAPLITAWSGAAPTIWYLHEVSLLQTLLASGRIDGAIAAATQIWAGSELAANIIRARRSDVLVLPYGVEPVEGVARAQDGPLEIGIFGSIERRKGQDLAIAGFKLLEPSERAGIRLRLYGRKLEPEFATAVLRDCDGLEEVSYEGERDRAGYLEAIGHMDAVLVSSRDDTLPLVSIDALSAGRMLLLTGAVGTTAWLTDDIDALIEPDADGAAMRALFARALAARSRAAAMGDAARDCFRRNFSREAFVVRFFDQIAIAKQTR
jgi:glycosyltransferase involved in cell wall biosynthesis